MNYLTKYLEKIGVKSFHELTPAEKETYRSWEEALDGKKLTDSDVAQFLVREENAIIEKLISAKLSEKDDNFYKAELSLIRKITGFLRTPELQKKMTEEQLINLIKE